MSSIVNSGSPTVEALACSIVEEHFGKVCETVCRMLFKKGRSSLPEIVAASKLTFDQVRQALLVLLQHNCVTVHTLSPMADAAARLASYMYETDVPEILHRLRFPRCVMHIGEMYFQEGSEPEADDEAAAKPGEGEDEEEADLVLHAKLMRNLLKYGRLRIPQLLHILYPSPDSGQPSPALEERVKKALAQLVRDGYMERAPLCRLPPASALRPLKGNSKTVSKMDPESSKEMEAKRRALARAARRRFCLPPPLLLLCPDAQTAAPPPPRKRVGGRAGRKGALSEGQGSAGAEEGDPAGRPKKRARKSQASQAAAEPSSQADEAAEDAEEGDPDSILWRANREQFCRIFLEEAMVEAVIRWRGKASAMLVWAILVAGRRAPYQDKISPPVSELSILQTLHLLQKNQPSVALPPANVEDKMRQVLADEKDPALLFAYPNELYGVDTASIVRFMRLRHVSSILRARFSPQVESLFQLVLDEKQVEPTRLHKQAIMDYKVLTTGVYDLLRTGFICIQDLAKTPDHSNCSTFYTLKVDIAGVNRTVGRGIVQAVLNLRLRLADEMRKQEQVLVAVGKRERAAMDRAEHKTALERLKTVSRILQTQMLALEADLLLFTGF